MIFAYFEKAAKENTEGVGKLQKGDAERAFHSLVKALSTLKKLRHLHTESQSPALANIQHNRCFKIINVPYLEDKGFFIYANALVFSTDLGKTSNGDSSRFSLADTLTLCEAIVLFNVALLYHQRGKHCGQDRALLGALDLYEQSQAILLGINAGYPEEVCMLKIAAMNNRIHILNEIANYPGAQEQVNELLLQSVNALAANNSGKGLSFLTKTDVDNFLLNALIIRRFNTAPCA